MINFIGDSNKSDIIFHKGSIHSGNFILSGDVDERKFAILKVFITVAGKKERMRSVNGNCR